MAGQNAPRAAPFEPAATARAGVGRTRKRQRRTEALRASTSARLERAVLGADAHQCEAAVHQRAVLRGSHRWCPPRTRSRRIRECSGPTRYGIGPNHPSPTPEGARTLQLGRLCGSSAELGTTGSCGAERVDRTVWGGRRAVGAARGSGKRHGLGTRPGRHGRGRRARTRSSS